MSDPVKTLRDEFAMEWMKGVLANPNQSDSDPESFAKCAYEMADAMLKARQYGAAYAKVNALTEKQAMQENLKPEFVVVPRVATEAMQDAAVNKMFDLGYVSNEHEAQEIWTAMVEAAGKEP